MLFTCFFFYRGLIASFCPLDSPCRGCRRRRRLLLPLLKANLLKNHLGELSVVDFPILERHKKEYIFYKTGFLKSTYKIVLDRALKIYFNFPNLVLIRLGDHLLHLLVRELLAKVHHAVLELSLADVAVAVAIKHPER